MNLTDILVGLLTVQLVQGSFRPVIPVDAGEFEEIELAATPFVIPVADDIPVAAPAAPIVQAEPVRAGPREQYIRDLLAVYNQLNAPLDISSPPMVMIGMAYIGLIILLGIQVSHGVPIYFLYFLR